MRSFLRSVALMAVTATVFVGSVRAEEKAVPLDQLPTPVTAAVKKMFPKAEMLKASREKEGQQIEYEVTVKENGKKIDVTMEESGEIKSLEKEMALKDLPKAVTKTLEKMYPQATQKSAEAVFEIEDGKEELEFYEIHLKTANDKEIEAKIKQNGKVVKDDEKEESEGEK